MPDTITTKDFLHETREDISSPTTSSFWSSMYACKNMVNIVEESLESDRAVLSKLKKSVKALHGAGLGHINNQIAEAENLEKLGSQLLSREADTGIGTTLVKFSLASKELSKIMATQFKDYYNMVLFPMDSLLKGDLKEIKGELRKPFDKALKDYENKSVKIEKEKKKLAQEAGLIRTEVTGSEMAEETEKERRHFQLQMCEYLIKVSEIKVKKSVELASHLVNYYHAEIRYFKESLEVLDNLKSHVGELEHELHELRTKQDTDKRELMSMRDDLKTLLQSEKESNKGGYSLHGLQGHKIDGTNRAGNLSKRSEGFRKIWQRRYCEVKDGYFTVAHSATSAPTQKLNLLLCQVKEDAEGKKHSFTLVSHNRTFLFQAEDEADLSAWVSVISNSRTEALQREFGNNDNESPENSSSSIVHNIKELRQCIVNQVQRLPGNDTCVDCTAKDPEWLSTNLGVITCIECSGIHREMGVHVSRVRSIKLDHLGTAELLLAKFIGNGGFNEIMEATLDYNRKPSATSNMDEKKEFIRAKYIKHEFAQKSGEAPEKILQELKLAVTSHDILAVLQCFGENVDLSNVLPGNVSQNTALHLAVEQADLKSLHIVDFLAQNGKAVNVSNANGDTPLHVAARKGKTEVAKLLLRSGAAESINSVNSNGKAPSDLARDEGHTSTAELIKKCSSGKLNHCDHVKIDWGMHQVDGIYDSPADLLDKAASDDEGLDDRTKTGPPTPPRHRRILPTRPVSQFMPTSRMTNQKDVEAVNALISGLALDSNDTGHYIPMDSVEKGSSPVVLRRKPPPPPNPGETVAVNVRASIAFTAPTGLSSFGHGPKIGNEIRTSGPLESPPPLPVRCSSVSRSKPPSHPPPPPAPKPTFDDTPPSRLLEVVKPSTRNRLATQDSKPKPPPVPTHRRSKSEGKSPFGEEPVTMTTIRPILEKNLSVPTEDTKNIKDLSKNRPAPPPRPKSIKKPTSDNIKPVTPGGGGSKTKPKPTTLPRPPSKPGPQTKTDANSTSKDQPEETSQQPPPPTTPAPDLPPRLYCTPAPSSHPRRVQALYDCEADNDDELSFKEGDIIVVKGDAEDAEWWVGSIEGKPESSGVFPISFVHVLPD